MHFKGRTIFLSYIISVMFILMVNSKKGQAFYVDYIFVS